MVPMFTWRRKDMAETEDGVDELKAKRQHHKKKGQWRAGNI